MKHVKTIIIVTCVTILIWVFAESESLRVQSVSGTVEIQPPATMAARVVDPEDFTGAVTIVLEGSAAGLDAIRDRLNDPLPITAAAGLPTTAGEHTIDLAAVLAQTDPFARQGVVIQDVDPPTLQVDMASIVEIDLPVVAAVSGEVQGKPVVDPEALKLRVPERLAKALPQDAAAVAPVPGDRLRGLPPGEARTIQNIALELPPILRGHWAVQPVGAAVANVTLTLRDTAATAVIQSVPVHVLLATTELGRWDITLDDPLIENVTIHGPSDLVERIAESMSAGPAPKDRIALIAILPLSFEELEHGITSKDVRFILQSEAPGVPVGAAMLHFEAPDTTVELTIRPAQEAQTPPA